MAIFYVDGRSIGNERRGQPRRAKIAIVYQWSVNPVPGPSDSKVFSKDIGDKTNVEAEYYALLEALSFISRSWAEKNRGVIPVEVGPIKIRSDSELIVKHLKGEYQVKEERLKPLREKAKAMIDGMGSIQLEWVPRDKNYAGLWLEGKWEREAEPTGLR